MAEAPRFYSRTTQVGLEKLRAARESGTMVKVTHMAVGDSGGQEYEPALNQTSLVNETWRGLIAGEEADPNDALVSIVTGLVPGTVGGFVIREAGLFDEDGDLVVISKQPAIEKPVIGDGSMVSVEVELRTTYSDEAAVSFSIDPNIVYATRAFVTETTAAKIVEHDDDASAHPDLIGNLAQQITDHNVASDAHQPKFDAQAADIRNVRKQIAFDNALQDFFDTGYADGFMLDCTEPDDIDAALSSGYVHDAVKGVFRSIDPALDSGEQVFNMALAEQEDVKGTITTLTVDTDDASGHFDSPINAKLVQGCRLVVDGQSYTISDIVGDGTVADSVSFTGSISAGEHLIDGAYGTRIDGNILALALQKVLGPWNASDGTIFGNFTGNHYTAGAAGQAGNLRAFDGVINQSFYSDTAACSKPEDGTSYLGVIWPSPRRLTESTITCPTDCTFNHCSQTSNITWQVQVSADTTDGFDGTWTTIYNAAWSESGMVQYSKSCNAGSGLEDTTAYKAIRLYLNGSYSPNDMTVAEWAMTGEYDAAIANILYSATIPLPTEWSAINFITQIEALNDANIWYTLRFGDVYKIWTGSTWSSIAKFDNDAWYYSDVASWQHSTEIVTAQAAISKALEFVDNRMDGATLATLVDANFSGTYPDGIAVTLHTTDSANAPSADAVTFDVTVAAQETILVFGDTINPELTFSPTTGQAITTIIPGSGVDLATDVTVEISKDGGTTFAELSLDPVIQDIAGSKKVCGFGDFPAGTDKEIALKVTAPAGKRIEVDVPALFGTN